MKSCLRANLVACFDFVLKSVNILIFMLLVYVFKTIVNNILGLGNLI